MKSHTHACIAYIVGRLIAGKSITSIYDYDRSREIDVESLPDAERLKGFNFVNWSYMPGNTGINRVRYHCSNGHSLALSIKGNTFIGYVRESSTHFIGNVRGDSVYIFDHKESAHFTFRIIGSVVEH